MPSKKASFDPALSKAVVQVGQGRGFIIEHRVKRPCWPRFLCQRIVLTAAHCLPYLPPCHAASLCHERTYKLLGTLDSPKAAVWAECLFADPIGDIAVLGEPDNQALVREAGAYEALTQEAPALKVVRTPESGRAWLLALDGEWVCCRVEVNGQCLWISPTAKCEGGMSGSPILADDGAAMGIVVVGGEVSAAGGKAKPVESGPHPVLPHHLPRWLLLANGASRK